MASVYVKVHRVIITNQLQIDVVPILYIAVKYKLSVPDYLSKTLNKKPK